MIQLQYQGSGTVVGTFKIYCPNENKYLLDDPNKNWVIESVNEDGGTHRKWCSYY